MRIPSFRACCRQDYHGFTKTHHHDITTISPAYHRDLAQDASRNGGPLYFRDWKVAPQRLQDRCCPGCPVQCCSNTREVSMETTALTAKPLCAWFTHALPPPVLNHQITLPQLTYDDINRTPCVKGGRLYSYPESSKSLLFKCPRRQS